MRLAIAIIGIAVACKREPPAKQVVVTVADAAIDAAIDAPVDPRVREVEASQIERSCNHYKGRLPLFIEPQGLECRDLAVIGCAELDRRCRTMPIGEDEGAQCRNFMAYLKAEVCNEEKAREHALVADPAAYLNRELRAAAEACKVAMSVVGRVPADKPEDAACTNIADGLRRLCKTSKSADRLAAALAKIKIVDCRHIDSFAVEPGARLEGDTLVVGTRDGLDDPDGKIACAIARALGLGC